MSFASDIGRMVARGPQRQLDDQESMTLLRLFMLSEEPVEEQILFYRELLPVSPGLAILDQRFRQHFGETQLFSPPLLLWLSTLADRPGNIVLLLAVLAHLKAEGREFSLKSLLDPYFADGIPTEKCYEDAWKAQKRTDDNIHLFRDENGNLPRMCDNVLDLAAAWK